MILIDTSAWVALYRDRTGAAAQQLAALVGGAVVVNAPFITTEVLQGARDEVEWHALEVELARLQVVDLPAGLWSDAARIYFDLRRAGLTVRSTIDCCIAQLCIAGSITLVHCDRDFDAIATVRKLDHRRLYLNKA